MIKDLVFHIGDPKNGSTAIQKALQARAWQCATVSIQPQPELNASALASSIRDTPDAEKRAAQFARKARWAEVHDADLGIVSAEFFEGVPPGALRDALEEFLPAQAPRARVIAYARPHASRLLSGFSQRIRSGGAVEPMEAYAQAMQQRGTLFYAARFGGWREVFGARFTLRPFLREELLGGDVTEDFFRTVLGDTPVTLERLPSTNETLMLEELAGLGLVQSVLSARGIPAYLRLSIGGAVGRGMSGIATRSSERVTLTRAVAEAAQEAYAEDARAVDAEFFGRPIMAPALERATEGTLATPQPLEAEASFDAAAVAELRAIGEKIATELTARPHAWRSTYQRRIGQKVEENGRMGFAQKRSAKRVWAALDRLCALLATGRLR